MAILEKITHKEEIEELIQSGEDTYNRAASNFQNQKERTTKSLETLGEIKLNSWSKDIEHFLSSFGCFTDVQMIIADGQDTFNKELSPTEMLTNMTDATNKATEILKVGALALGTGALVGVAAYGGVMMFGHAATGTAIASLAGAAKTSATLAWFGGGSLAAGGLGIKGGIAVLGAAVVIPALLVAGTIAFFKGKERLAEAQKIHDQNVNNAKKIDVQTEKIRSIEVITNDYSSFIKKISTKFNGLLDELDRMIAKYGNSKSIKASSLSEVEQKTLHLSWLMAQVYYQILATRLLTENGNITKECSATLSNNQEELNHITAKILDLEKEKNEINKKILFIKSKSSENLKRIDSEIKKTEKLINKISKLRTKEVMLDSLAIFENLENIDLEKTISNVSSDDFNKIYSNVLALKGVNKKPIDFLFSINDESIELDIRNILLYQYEQYLEKVSAILNYEYGNVSLDKSSKIVEAVKSLTKNIKQCSIRIEKIYKSLNIKRKYCKKYIKNLRKYINYINKIQQKNDVHLNLEQIGTFENKRILLAFDSFILLYLIGDMRILNNDFSLVDNKNTIKLCRRIYKRIKHENLSNTFKNMFGSKRKDK